MAKAGFAVFLVFTISTAGRANEVTAWNETCFRSALVASSSALNMTRFGALVHAAMFDAVNGIERRYTQIHVDPDGPADASPSAAAMQAAYSILVRLYGQGGLFTPNQQATLDADLAASLARISKHEGARAIAKGRDWGQKVADAIWAWRATDGYNIDPPIWVGMTTLGQWRPTPNDPYVSPPTLARGAGYPQFSSQTTWSIPNSSYFRPVAPPLLTSRQYARDFNETKRMGSQTSTARSSDQTIAAWFWATGTASYFWNHAALSVLDSGDNSKGRDDDGGKGRDNDKNDNDKHDNPNTLLRNTRVLAALNIAMADAAIGCWDAKYTYNFWRPITAIRETADDGNAATTADPTWTPLFATPAHPDYPSGHSCVSGAATTVLAEAFGERTSFDVTSDLMLGVTRSFRSFAEALEEVKNARIFSGIHFRTATEVGTVLGKQVAQYVLEHSFLRLRE